MTFQGVYIFQIIFILSLKLSKLVHDFCKVQILQIGMWLGLHHPGYMNLTAWISLKLPKEILRISYTKKNAQDVRKEFTGITGIHRALFLS